MEKSHRLFVEGTREMFTSRLAYKKCHPCTTPLQSSLKLSHHYVFSLYLFLLRQIKMSAVNTVS